MNVTGHNGHLQSFIERVERLNEELANLSADRTEVFKEAKSAGFDPKIMREIVKIRAMDQAKRAEHQALLETYMDALGMLADLPLGQAAMGRV